MPVVGAAVVVVVVELVVGPVLAVVLQVLLLVLAVFLGVVPVVLPVLLPPRSVVAARRLLLLGGGLALALVLLRRALALLPRGPKGWEPLCGFYRRRALISLEEAIAQGQRSFQGWLATVEVEALPLESMAPIQNCNTPAEWQRFQHWDARAWDARA
ncbi:MAG: hypothetical protein HC857_06095 [Synechococcales cyanobacterium RU_4_20]|nr:hypothetical protein [Synechococcales cyanobacterium RU_4_20]